MNQQKKQQQVFVIDKEDQQNGNQSSQTVSNIMNQFLHSEWTDLFQKHVFKTRILKLDTQFYSFLQSDGLFINPKYKENDFVINKDQYSKTIDQESKDKFTDFNQLDEKLLEILEEFDYQCFVKLNWKTPYDSEELENNTVFDIFYNLKSSQILGQMISDYSDWIITNTEGKKEIKHFELVIKKSYKLKPQREFRCFVYNGLLKGICQRNTFCVFETLLEKECLDLFKNKLVEFLQETVIPIFIEKNFAIDVYFDIPPNNKIRIIDFNPWREFTDPILFNYEELENEKIPFSFKIVNNSSEIKQKNQKREEKFQMENLFFSNHLTRQQGVYRNNQEFEDFEGDDSNSNANLFYKLINNEIGPQQEQEMYQ